MKGWTGLHVRGSLGHRLAAMTVLALLPMGLLGIALTNELEREAQAGRQLAASGAMLRAAAPEIALIGSTRQLVKTLARTIVPVLEDEAACDQFVDDVSSTVPVASLVAYIPMDGQMRCASNGAQFDFSGRSHFQHLIAVPEARMVVNPDGPVSGTSVLGVAHPVFRSSGEQSGIVVISLPHLGIDIESAMAAGSQRLGGRPGTMITFDAQGTVLTSSSGLDAAARYLPLSVSLPDLARRAPTTFSDNAGTGALRLMSVLPLTDGLYLLGSWPVQSSESRLPAVLAAYLVPLLTWIAGLAVALFAAERLVTRHVRKLSRSMLAFARGNRTAAMPNLRDPPAEILALDEAYRAMIQTIQHDEAELENLLLQKAALLREVHHRTGNSLQLIASVMAMHLREDPGDETRQVLSSLQERVMGLATVHTGLYRIVGDDEVEMNALIAEVIGKVVSARHRAGNEVDIRHELQPLRLSAEQAVPLALLLAEVLAAFPSEMLPENGPPLRVALTNEANGEARLQVSGPAVAPALTPTAARNTPDRISSRLMRAFVAQLAGRMELLEQDGFNGLTVQFMPRHPR